ncbi:MAG TPA: DUF1476 domain-containing protein [Beijerinckiaceae bacterium]|nr:DUF1476 domain-containing protein [Beijerinckiaceae bacterium]
MSTFDKREEGFEQQFAHDEELRFRAKARRDKLVGLWAAGLLGKSGTDAETYVASLIVADVAASEGDAVFRKIRGDFDGAGIAQSDHQIHRRMDELLAKAVEEIKAGK